MSDRQIVLDGQFVSERISQVVNAIREYSPELDVEWCPPHKRRPGQAAFKIIHRPIGGAPYTIFHVKTEAEFDARVLKRIIAGDARNGGMVTMSEIEAAEEAAKRVAHQRFVDQIEEANEIAHAIMKSPKSTYKVNDNLILKDYLPGNHAPRKRSF